MHAPACIHPHGNTPIPTQMYNHTNIDTSTRAHIPHPPTYPGWVHAVCRPCSYGHPLTCHTPHTACAARASPPRRQEVDGSAWVVTKAAERKPRGGGDAHRGGGGGSWGNQRDGGGRDGGGDARRRDGGGRDGGGDARRHIDTHNRMLSQAARIELQQVNHAQVRLHTPTTTHTNLHCQPPDFGSPPGPTQQTRV